MTGDVYVAILVGTVLGGYGTAYLLAKTLERLHRRKVQLQNAKALLEWQFNNGPAQWETRPAQRWHATRTSANQARMKYGRRGVTQHSNGVHAPWADSRDWTGRP